MKLKTEGCLECSEVGEGDGALTVAQMDRDHARRMDEEMRLSGMKHTSWSSISADEEDLEPS
ncbi:MAG: hypothetical protein HQL07_00040 [Nitrospirae bacterium]|nr:hypothetical protein [Magnetococcales bacterium]HAT49675.1 hypothetical protein [Alphaproteobacteria bacterium]